MEEKNPALLTALLRNGLDMDFVIQPNHNYYFSELGVSKQGVQGKLHCLSPLALALCLCFLMESFWEGGILSALDRGCTK